MSDLIDRQLSQKNDSNTLEALDCVSRQAAIDDIKAVYEWHDTVHDTVTEGRILDHLRRLPSAQPERKTGRWIPHEDEDGEHYGDKCSECGEWYVMPYGKTNFCPHCGANMRGEQDG